MSSTLIMWSEIAFDIGYLAVIWILVAKMFRKAKNVNPKHLLVARSLMMAFVLLAIGDTGHVGFRVLAYYLGGLHTKLNLFGGELSLVGPGALATAVTITLFYVVMLDVWRKRFNFKYGIFEYVLIIAAIIRLILFIHPGNLWSSVVPPFGWSLARNIPLIIQGVGVAYLFLRDGIKYKDQMFIQIGAMVLISYLCYMPVILLVQKNSWIGMLMIPKTLAYVAMAIISYKALFANVVIETIKPPQINKSI